MNDDFDVTVEPGELIPTVDQDPEYQLNLLAKPLGHTVVRQDGHFRIHPTGGVDNHQCRHLAVDAEYARQYLATRGARREWTLDMQDDRYTVERGPESTSVYLKHIQTGRRYGPISGGVSSSGGQTAVTGFYVTTDQPPPTGGWYR